MSETVQACKNLHCPAQSTLPQTSEFVPIKWQGIFMQHRETELHSFYSNIKIDLILILISRVLLWNKRALLKHIIIC